MNLAEIDTETWHALERVGKEALSGFRYVNLCTVDVDNRPQARLVVLRSADPKRRTTEIHTDIRSQKWTEIGNNSSATVLGFDPEKGLQLRLQGTAFLYPLETEIAVDAWSRLPSWTRATYTLGATGQYGAHQPDQRRTGE